MTASVRDRLPLAGEGVLPGALAILALLLVAGLGPWVLAVAVAFPVLWAIARRPQLGVLLLAALAPFHGLLVIAGLPSFATGWKEVLVGFAFVLTFLCPRGARAAPGRRLPGWAPAIGGLLAIGVASAALVGNPEQAAIGLRLGYYSVLVAITLWRCPLSRRERDVLVTILMVVGFLTAIYGIAQQAIGHQNLAQWGYRYDEQIRFTDGMRLRSFSTFIQPFPFAYYLMIVLLVGVPVSLGDPRRTRSTLFFVALPVFGLALMFSYVRGAWMGLALGLVYLAFHRYKVLVLGIPIALTAVLFLPNGSLQSAAFQSRSVNARTHGWSAKIGILGDHPLGTGIATTGAAAEKVVKDTRGGGSASNQGQIGLGGSTFQPDNSYLKVGFELGLVGLWLFVLLLVSAFVTLRGAERRVRGTDADLVAGISAQVLAVMVASFFATYFEIYPAELFFWLLLAVGSTLPFQMVDEDDVNLTEARSR